MAIENVNEKEIKKRISLYLRNKLGILPNKKGHNYLIEAITSTLVDWPVTIPICELYKLVAEKNQTTAARIERCIRTAIDSADEESMKAMFIVAYKRGKRIKNGEFISTIAEVLYYSL